MSIMLELLTWDDQFQELFILYLAFMSSGKYRFNQLWPLTLLMDKLDACSILSRKLRLYNDTRKPQHFTLVNQQYIGKTTQFVLLLLNLKYLLLELNTLTFLSVFYKNNLTIVFLLQNIRSLVLLMQICEPNHCYNHVQVQLSSGVINGWLGSDSIWPVIQKIINSWD